MGRACGGSGQEADSTENVKGTRPPGPSQSECVKRHRSLSRGRSVRLSRSGHGDEAAASGHGIEARIIRAQHMGLHCRPRGWCHGAPRGVNLGDRGGEETPHRHPICCFLFRSQTSLFKVQSAVRFGFGVISSEPCDACSRRDRAGWRVSNPSRGCARSHGGGGSPPLRAPRLPSPGPQEGCPQFTGPLRGHPVTWDLFLSETLEGWSAFGLILFPL